MPDNKVRSLNQLTETIRQLCVLFGKSFIRTSTEATSALKKEAAASPE
jgi:hypothetical protein